MNVVSLPEVGRVLYFENYIEKLKKEDEDKRIAGREIKTKLENIERNSKTGSLSPAGSKPRISAGQSLMPPWQTQIK
jgi:hypothetical protein